MQNFRIRAAVMAAVAVAPLAISIPAQSAPSDTAAAVTGWAQMYFPAPGNDVEISVNAHATFGPGEFPTNSWGTFRIYHRIDESGGETYVNWGDFAVDCVTVGGPTATVTGTLVRAAPGSPWQLGVRTGLSFYVDGAASRIGIAGMPTPPLSKCMAPAANAPLVLGGYQIRS
ncbi:MAG TPA: hypothetical protein VJ914_32890 [Pseudonocardiaceae bacterium]|nr:hypothetical protein [Pseudonocardiaceae bacterium]